MNQNKKEAFLNQIREKREEQKRSIRQVSEAIRIAPEFLEAIEDGRFEDLPEGYSTMFLKSYLKHLQLDITGELQQLNELFLADDAKKIFDEKEQNGNFGKNFYIDKLKLRKFLSWLPAIFIIILVCYFAVHFFAQEKKTTNEVKEISIKEALATIDTVVVDTRKRKKHIEMDSLEFEFTALLPVFMLAKIDSRKIIRFNAKRKQKIKIKVKEKLNIYLSDGSKMSLLFKDSVYSHLSDPDVRVLYMIFDRNGIKSKGLKKRDQIPIKDSIPISISNKL